MLHMEYSDIGFYDEDGERDVSECLGSDDADVIDEDECALDAAIEEQENEHCYIEQAYHSLFVDEDSQFRLRFPQDYEDEERSGYRVPDLRWVLDPPPQITPAAGSVPGADGDVGSVRTTLAPPGSDVIATEERGGGTCIRLRDSAATRRLKTKPHAIGVLYSLEDAGTSITKQQVQQHLAETLRDTRLPIVCATESVFVGCINRAAIPLALVVVDWRDDSNEAAANELLQRLPHARRLTVDESDMRPFYREEHVAQGKRRTDNAALVAGGAPRRITGCLDQLLKNAQLLAEKIGSAGGVEKCRFFAVDVEAAVVYPGCVPLPLEMAFIECCPQGEDEPQELHTFVHPGAISDEIDRLTAMRLSTLMVPGGHGIPFYNCTFLSSRYGDMARRIDALWRAQPEVIFINKGSIMDVQAVRWVYAAAREVVGDAAAPQLNVFEIPVFDVSTLREAVGLPAVCSADEKELFEREKALVGRCWYHGDMRDVFEGAHCAKHDARALAAVVQGIVRDAKL